MLRMRAEVIFVGDYAVHGKWLDVGRRFRQDIASIPSPSPPAAYTEIPKGLKQHGCHEKRARPATLPPALPDLPARPPVYPLRLPCSSATALESARGHARARARSRRHHSRFARSTANATTRFFATRSFAIQREKMSTMRRARVSRETRFIIRV